MVAVLLRLKRDLLVNGFRRSIAQTIGFWIAALYALVVVIMLVGACVGLSTLPVADARAWLVVGGSVVVLGWWILPSLTFGVDATLDPRRFEPYGVRRRDLVVGLALAALVGIPGAATVLASVGTAVVWWRHPVALGVGVVGGLLGAAVCVVGARAIAATVAPLAEKRRFREVVAVLTVAPLVILAPLLGQLADNVQDVADAVLPAADVLAWTPLGAPWSLGGDVAAGHWLSAFARLLITLATIAVLLAAWDRALTATAARPPAQSASGRAHGFGWFDRLPDTPTGAVAARALTYWLRDPRYVGSTLYLPFLPIPFVVLGGVEGNMALLWVAPLTGFLMGFSTSADLAYDNTAWWSHLASGVAGRADRAGRALAAAVIGTPLVVLFSVGAVWAVGAWALLPAVLAASLGVLAVALGASAVLSAVFVYQVPKPGDGPLSQPSGGMTAIIVAQMAAFLVTGVLSLPIIVALVVAIVSGSALATVATVLLSVVCGAGVLLAGLRIGGRYLDRSGPQILAQLVAIG